MSDYCKQCSIEVFGEDFEDFAGIITEQETALGLAAEVLCEGCGEILVDHNGSRIEQNEQSKQTPS